MKKYIKSIIIFTVIVILLNISPCYAALGRVDRIKVAPDGWNIFTPDNGVFNISGSDKEFILLDTVKDDETRFLVMTKDFYGSRVFDPDGSQKFDTEDPNNIAYWLNNEFLTAENTLPKDITDYIDYNAEWETEAGVENGNCPEGYTAKCGISLISLTEWYKYYRKVGMTDECTRDAWWFRTPRGIAGGKDTILAASAGLYPGLAMNYSSSSSLGVRPVFYLKKEFFSNVKLDFVHMGSDVRRVLSEEYSNEELSEAGYMPYEIKRLSVGEEFQLSMDDEIGRVFSPGKARFNIIFRVSGAKPIKYTVKYNVTGEQEFSEHKDIIVYPYVSQKEQFHIGVSLHGIYKLNIQIISDGMVLREYNSDFSVISDYRPHFMEQYTRRGFVTQHELGNRADATDDIMSSKIGIRHIRDGSHWTKTELEKGNFDFTYTDTWFNRIQNDIDSTVLGLWYGHPAYITARGSGMADKYPPISKKEIAAFTNYAAKVAERYKKINSFELWNEPDRGAFWLPNSPKNSFEYTNLLRETNEAVKKVRPDSEIIAGSMAWSVNTQFISEVFRYGGYPYMDGISYHLYTTEMAHDIVYQNHYDLVSEQGGWKKFFITETGFPTHNTGFTEDEQAYKFVRNNVLADYYHVDGNYFFTFRNSGNTPTDKEHNFGVMNNDRTAKPVYLSASTYYTQLAGAVFLGKLPCDNDDIKMYLYIREKTPVVVAWNEGEKIVLNLDENGITVNNWLNNPMQDRRNVVIDENAVYIENVNQEWVNRAAVNQLNINYNRIKSMFEGELPEGIIDVLEVPADTEFNAQNVEDGMKGLYDLGDKILDLYSQGKLEISVQRLSQMLSEINTAGSPWIALKAYYSNVNIEDINGLSSYYSNEKLINQMKNDVDTERLPYAEAINKYVYDYALKAEEILKSEENGNIKLPWASAFDYVAQRLAGWAHEMALKENSVHSGIIMYISPDDIDFQFGVLKQIDVSVKGMSIAKAKIRLEDEDGNVLGESEEESLSADATVKLPVLVENTTAQRLTTKLSLICGDKVIRSQLMPVWVEEPLAFEIMPADTSLAEYHTLRLKVKNTSKQTLSGIINIDSPEGWRLTGNNKLVSVAANEEKIIEYPIDSKRETLFNEYIFAVSLKLSTSDKTNTVKYIPLSFTAVKKADSEIVPQAVTEDLTQFKDAYPIYIGISQDATKGEWNKSDLAAKAYLKWDKDNFYIASVVYDDSFRQIESGSDIWRHDSIQVAIDTLCEKPTKYTGYIYEYGAALSPEGAVTYCWQAAAPNTDGQKPSEWTNVIRNDQMCTTTYIMKIPRSDLEPMPLEEKHTFGFNIGINDSDVFTREDYIELTPGIIQEDIGKNPSYFKNFVLVK